MEKKKKERTRTVTTMAEEVKMEYVRCVCFYLYTLFDPSFSSFYFILLYVMVVAGTMLSIREPLKLWSLQ